MAQFEDEDIERLITQLEAQELTGAEAPTPEIYTQLMGLYLLKHDLINAKFLWKRTPLTCQKSQPELEKLWFLGQCLWQHNLPTLYTFAGQTAWSELTKPVVTALLEKTRQRQLDLVSRAYACIEADQLAAMLGLTTVEVVANVTSHGWIHNPTGGMLHPPKAVGSGDPSAAATMITKANSGDSVGVGGSENDPMMNAELITNVTRFMSFIENH